MFRAIASFAVCFTAIASFAVQPKAEPSCRKTT